MRRLHRWVSIVAAFFLLNVSVTGAMLALDEGAVLISGLQRPIYAYGTLSDAQLAQALTATEEAAQRQLPGQRLLSVKLRVYHDIAEGIVWTDEFTPFAYVFDARSGAMLTPNSEHLSKFFMPWHMHQLVKRMHRGDILGLSGRWMGLLTGLSLLFLAISGIVMYFDLLGNRRGRGHRELFWR